MNQSFTLSLGKRLKPFGVAFSFGAFLASLAAVSLSLSFALSLFRAQAMTRFLEAKEKEMAALARSGLNPPSVERLRFLENQGTELEKFSEDIMQFPLFWPKPDYSDEARLEFKEELHAFRERFEKLMASKNAVVEKEAELPDFKETLPEKDALPGLFMAVKLSEELRTAILESGVQRIISLNFPEAHMEDLGNRITRFEFPFELSVDTNWRNLMRLLQALQNSTRLWVLERISIENQAAEGASQGVVEAPLRVQMALSSLFYARRNENEGA